MYAYIDDEIKKIIQTGNRELINKLIHGEDELVCLPEEMPQHESLKSKKSGTVIDTETRVASLRGTQKRR